MTLQSAPDAHQRSTRSSRPPSGRGKLTSWLLAALLCTAGIIRLQAQSDVPGDPTGSAGDFDGTSTTGSSYDTYTGNSKRMITDVIVPGTAGFIPLKFTRIYNARTNVVPSWVGAHFGDANWRHNYQWEGQITSSNGNTVYRIGYPDGRVVNFRLNRANQVSDAFARGPAPVADRFAVNPNGDGKHYLHLADGSQVRFDVAADSAGNNNLLVATCLIDPFGAVTTLHYSSYQTGVGNQSVNVLSYVLEPGGRGLALTYGTRSTNGNPNNTLYIWPVITGVYWYDSAGNVQRDVTYGYTVYGPNQPNESGQTTIYCALSSAVYSQPQQANPQAYVSASYTYQAANNPGMLTGSAASHTAGSWSVSWLPSGAAVQRVFSLNGWLTDEYDGMHVDGSQNPVVPAPGRGMTHTGSSYNVLGQPTSTTDAEGFATTYAYDACNRPSTAVDPLGGPNHTVTRAYYAAGEPASNGSGTNCTGLLKSVTSPGPDLDNFPTALTQYTAYDQLGRLSSTIDPYNHTYNSGFDAGGNLSSQSDGASTTRYASDGLGRRSQITYPADNTTEQWTYDASGNVSTFKNRAGAICTYQYNDGRNRCTGYSWNDNITQPQGYAYDAAGHLTEVSNYQADVKFTYDDSGALLSESSLLAGQSAWVTTRYTHDADGNVDSINYPNTNYPTFTYDDQQRCLGMSSYGVQYGTYNYSGDRLASRVLYNGFLTAYEYQNNGRAWDVWHIDGTRNKNISRRCYGFAPDGRISWFDREGDGGQSGSSLENGNGDAYYYWPDGSLGIAYRDFSNSQGWPARYSATADSRVNPNTLGYTNSTAQTYGTGYNYDAAGNRHGSMTVMGNNYNYYVNSSNQYNGSLYDLNGNTTDSATGWTYKYDAENRLTSATGPNGQSAVFYYDGLGRMTLQIANGVYTLCYYAGAQRIEERNSNNQPVYQYFYDAPGSDHVLFRQGGGWGRLWYQTDLMGNTTHLSMEQYDAQGHLTGGKVVEQYSYDAYGTPTVYNAAGAPLGGSQFDNRYLFKSSGGYMWLSQMQLYYCRARFYLPVHGRFLQPDPIGQAGGLNVYGYCHNDPINNMDPSGTHSISYILYPVTIFDPLTGFFDTSFFLIPVIVDPGVVPSNGGGKSGGNNGGGKTGGGGGTGTTGGSAPIAAVPPPAAPPTQLVSLQEGPRAVLAHFAAGGDMHSSMEVGQTFGHGAMNVAAGGLGVGAAVEAAPIAYGFIVSCRATITSIVATVTGYFASHPEVVEEGEQEAEGLLQKVQEGGAAAEEVGVVEEGALATRCFPSGTQVSTPRGDVNIENIKVGDKVYACDLQTGEVQEQTVTELIRNFTYHWADVQVGAEAIRATRSHPFWVESKQ